jgi:hypothetical protein
MKFTEKIQPRDVVAVICLIAIFILLSLGFDGWLQGIGAVIIGYYFSKRVYEEKNVTTVAKSETPATTQTRQPSQLVITDVKVEKIKSEPLSEIKRQGKLIPVLKE